MYLLDTSIVSEPHKAEKGDAEFHIPDQSPLNDACIAAIAKSTHLTVVIRNVRDVEGFGVSLPNPFV